MSINKSIFFIAHDSTSYSNIISLLFKFNQL
nr:MAG TPA: hypothetical protein [Caudoviricetes sp.]